MSRQFDARGHLIPADSRPRVCVGVLGSFSTSWERARIRPDGSRWVEIAGTTVKGWVPPINPPDERVMAVTDDPDGYPIGLGQFDINASTWRTTAIGVSIWYIPCETCFQESWGEGSEDLHWEKALDREPGGEFYYCRDSGRVITPCDRCGRRLMRNDLYRSRYNTYFPTIEEKLRFHLDEVEYWHKGWAFKEPWCLGAFGDSRPIDIGNCRSCGIAGRMDKVCVSKYCPRPRTRRLLYVNRGGWVVHPSIVAYFCGHHYADFRQPTEVCQLPPTEYLFGRLDFEWCTEKRPTLTDITNPEGPPIPNLMKEKDIALFRMVDEYNGHDKDYMEVYGWNAKYPASRIIQDYA